MDLGGEKIVSAAKICGLCVMLVLIAGCSRDPEPELLNLRSDGTPDEFGILPTAPLTEPESYASLPEPTPGGRNLVDPQPEAEAVAALGGRPGVAASRAGDGALLNATGRFGVDPAIRQQLAAEDLAFRQQNRGRPIERLFNLNVYFRAYEGQSLDQHAELERFRRAGVTTPAAPPVPER